MLRGWTIRSSHQQLTRYCGDGIPGAFTRPSYCLPSPLLSLSPAQLTLCPPVRKRSTVSVERKMPDFMDHKEVYKSKSLRELLRAYFVFSLCSVDMFVDNQLKLLKWARKLSGRWLFRKTMRASMYGQFLGGEEKAEVLARSRELCQSGLYPMFAYTAAEVHGVKDTSCGRLPEEQWNHNFESLKRGIDMAADAKKLSPYTPQLSAKLTFLSDAELLRRVSSVISNNEEKMANVLNTGAVDSKKIQEVIKLLQEQTCWPGFTNPENSRIQSLESLLAHMPFHVSTTAHKTFFEGLDLQTPAPDDLKALHEFWQKFKELGERAKDRGIHMVWDAEQTYLQPAIEACILDSIRLFNNESTIIFNTYQCYLKRTQAIIKRDLRIAESEGLHLGCKVVRGAYMDEERRLAKEHGYEDPVNDNYDATTANYHAVVDLAVDVVCRNQNQKQLDKVLIIFATHNADTVKYALEKLENIDVTGGCVRFAQLYGMRDHISFALGHHGYPAAKLLHYGDIEEGVAYLSRRVSENRSGVPTASLERKMLKKELIRRVLRL